MVTVFSEYENTLSQKKAVESKVVSLIRGTGVDPSNRYSPLARLGGNALSILLRSVPVAGPVLDKEKTDEALVGIIEGGAEGIARMRSLAAEWLHTELSSEEQDLYLQAHESLGRDLATGIRAICGTKPLLLILDTYEIVDNADPFLRLLIKQAGPDVIWVISGRRNLAESVRIGRKAMLGYSGEFGSAQIRTMPVSEFSVV